MCPLFPDPAPDSAADEDAHRDLGGKVSALRPTNRDPRRFTVKIDGRAKGTLSEKLIADLGLRVGSPWTAALEAQMAEAVIYDRAFRAATRRLARRAMSTGMVRQKLRELNYPNRRPARNSKSDHTTPPKQTAKPADPIPPAVIDQVVQRLTELELLDDRAYGQMLIRDLTRGKPAGPALLKQKLYAKGLDRKLIDELVAEATDDPDQQAEDATDFAR